MLLANSSVSSYIHTQLYREESGWPEMDYIHTCQVERIWIRRYAAKSRPSEQMDKSEITFFVES